MDHQFHYKSKNMPSNNFCTTFGYNSNDMNYKANHLQNSNDYQRQLDEGLEFVNNILKENNLYQNTSNKSDNNHNFYNNKSMNIPEKNNEVRTTNRAHNKENLNPDLKLPVESRLNMINEVYKMRRDERAQLVYKTQQDSIKSPQINAYSKELLESKYSNNCRMGVNQRLYEDHRKRQIALDMKQKLIEKQTKAMAHPNVENRELNSPYNTSQCFKAADGKKIVTRLLDYKNKYADNEVQLKVKYDDKDCTFQPKINANSKKYAEKVNQGMPIEFRNSVDSSKYKNKRKTNDCDNNCTFKPNVNEKSKMMVQTRQYNEGKPNNVFQRLIANKEDN